jgi:hypothetical protein
MLAGLAAVALLGGALTGCGGDGDEPAATRAEAVAIVTDDLFAHARADPLSRQDARCMARAVVDDHGVERLTEVGLDLGRATPPELTVPPMTPREGDRVYAVFDDCLGFERRDIQSFGAGGLTPAQARCASRHYRGSSLPRTHLLLRNHDEVPHGDLHRRVEALWNEAIRRCRV